MARGASITVENSFNRGLITEFTAMNFPEQAVTDADNVVFGELGRVTRRPGMDFEDDYVVRATLEIDTPEEALVEYRWSSVGEDGTKTFVAQQIGARIRFFEVVEGVSLSGSMKSFFVNLETYATGGNTAATIATHPCHFTDGRGYLFVTHPRCDPIYIEYNEDSDTITINSITIQIRDFEGVEDNLDVDARPGTLSNLHKYNLFNQGWYANIRYSDWDGPIANAITAWTRVYWIKDNTEPRGDYPSNADAWWYFTRVDVESGIEYFSGPTIETRTGLYGNTPVAKGHYIYNAFNVNRSAKSGIAGLPSDNSGGARPSVCVFYAGRVWYGGTPADKYSSKMYFSQTITSDRQFGRCYQNNDPTSKELFDLLDTDGGVIDLPKIERVVSMKVVGDVLVVFGTNGIYTIRGDNEGPFRATSYTVSFISTVGAVSDLSIIDVDGNLIWWNYDGIYTLARGQLGQFEVQNMSKQTIQSLVDDIPPANKNFVKGDYNRREQLVRWIFSDAANLSGYKYNRILEFNVVSQAFYTHTISSGPAVMSGIISIYGQSSDAFLENVTDSGGVPVTVGVSENVQIEVSSVVPNQEIFKFLVTGDFSGTGQRMTYAEMNDTGLVDWRSLTGGTEYLSYGVAGYRVRGDFLRSFTSTPIEFVVDMIQDGSLLVRGIWDYGARMSIPQELYRLAPGASYLLRRIKLRGKGRSMQIRFESVGTKPFSLVGWSSYDTGGILP